MNNNMLKLIHSASLQTTYDLLNIISENGTIHLYELWRIYNKMNYKNVRMRILELVQQGLVIDLGIKVNESNKTIRDVKLSSKGKEILDAIFLILKD